MPLLDRMLRERLKQKDDGVAIVLSEYLAEIIARASRSNPAKLSLALQSTIAPAISKEIANNKDKMIDALYPVMGGMVSKYVSEAIREFVESVNAKIEDGLSFDRYKRKIKSKISGVSESELLLQESTESIISSLVVIHKESGLLIAEAHLDEQGMEDYHIVASMATAIKDFINDWIQKGAKQGEVQILSYGNATLYIESAGSVYLIAFLDSVPNQELRSGINTFFATLVQSYMEVFQNFEGDSSSDAIKVLTRQIQDYLNSQERLNRVADKRAAKKPMKYLLVTIGIALLVYMGYVGKVQYFEYALEKKVAETTGCSVKVIERDEKVVLIGRVSSFEAASKIEEVLKKHTHKPIDNQLSIPLIHIHETIEAQEERASVLVEKLALKVAQKEKRLDAGYSEKIATMALKITQLEKHLHDVQKHLKITSKSNQDNIVKINQLTKQHQGVEKIAKVKQDIIRGLGEVFRGNVLFNMQEGSLDFANTNLFDQGSDQINEEAKSVLKSLFEAYITALFKERKTQPYIQGIVIEGHTDSSGSYRYNLALSQQRAASVMAYLLSLNIVKKYQIKSLIRAEGLANQDTVKVSGVEDKEASRRIKIKFEMQYSKIMESIEKMLND